MGAMGWRDAVTGAAIAHMACKALRHVMAWDAVMVCDMVRHGKERHEMARYRVAWHGINSVAWHGVA